MSSPIILLVGNAGSGKDATANLIATKFNAASIALADPMKAFVYKTHGFTEEQLWGPSAFRNAKDARFASEVACELAFFSIKEHAVEFLYGLGLEPDRFTGCINDWAHTHLKQALKDGGLTPRTVLQTLGTEVIRNVAGKDVWINHGLKVAKLLLVGGYTYGRLHGLIPSPGTVYDYVTIIDGRFRNEIVCLKQINGKVIQILDPSPKDGVVDRAGVKGHQSEAEQSSVPSHWYDAILHNNKAYGLEALEDLVEEVMEYCFGSMGQLFVPVESVIKSAADKAS
jgi:hypothetical protein